MIICEEPGMGKSTILTSFGNLIQTNQEKKISFIKIILSKIKSKLVDSIDTNRFDSFHFLIKLLIPQPTQIEKELLRNLANSDKLILMFDGLDEVLDYKVEFLKLVDKLRSLNLNKIILTSREHAKSEFEDRFQSFAFKL